MPSLGASGAIYASVTMTALAFPGHHMSSSIPPFLPRGDALGDQMPVGVRGVKTATHGSEWRVSMRSCRMGTGSSWGISARDILRVHQRSR
jgi:hypothetical protein